MKPRLKQHGDSKEEPSRTDASSADAKFQLKSITSLDERTILH
jgi:hypothetical protein